MFGKNKVVWVSVTIVAAMLCGIGMGTAMAKVPLNPVSAEGIISAAYQKVEGMLRLVNGEEDIKPSEVFIQWNRVGPEGPQGPKGDKGDQGIQGPPGDVSGIKLETKTECLWFTNDPWDGTNLQWDTVYCPSGWEATGGGYQLYQAGFLPATSGVPQVVGMMPVYDATTELSGWKVLHWNWDVVNHDIKVCVQCMKVQ